jgi:hypothetical protein
MVLSFFEFAKSPFVIDLSFFEFAKAILSWICPPFSLQKPFCHGFALLSICKNHFVRNISSFELQNSLAIDLSSLEFAKVPFVIELSFFEFANNSDLSSSEFATVNLMFIRSKKLSTFILYECTSSMALLCTGGKKLISLVLNSNQLMMSHTMKHANFMS